MRLKFFLLILTVLILCAGGVTYVHTLFSRNERLHLLDSQIRESARVLVNSELSELNRINFSVADQIISEELGPDRIAKLFVIRNDREQVVFASDNVSLLNLNIPRHPQWVTIQKDPHLIRVLNLKLPSVPNRTLQVGAIVDSNFLDWRVVNHRAWLYVAAVVAALFAISAGLTLILMQPVRVLATHLREASTELGTLRRVAPLPERLLLYRKSFWGRTDEFSTLLSVIDRLISRINKNHRMTRAWTFQMAHELKTPLALARISLEDMPEPKPKEASSTEKHLDRMGRTISQFLNWVETENSGLARDMHALRLADVVREAVLRVPADRRGRIELDIEDAGSILADPLHVEQLIDNAITNALKFSPEQEPVRVSLREMHLEITDRGPGIPEQVTERMGEPFNIGPVKPRNGERSSGLGLAWMTTVSRIYSWNISFNTGMHGTTITVDFTSSKITPET